MDGHHDDDGHGHGVGEVGEGVALYKVEAILITLLIALAGGLIPIKRQTSAKVLSLGNCFSGGIFISAAFLHMLQESVEGFSNLPLKSHFPMAMFCSLIGVLIPFFIERVVLSGHHSHSSLINQDKSKSQSSLGIYVLWLMLGVHSIIEGAAVGIIKNYDDITPILLAIVAHKFFSAFALGISLVKGSQVQGQNHQQQQQNQIHHHQQQQPQQDQRRIIQLIISFSCSTPAGIILGWVTSNLLSGSLNSLTTEIVKGIAAGTFIYVAMAEILLEEFSHSHQSHYHSPSSSSSNDDHIDFEDPKHSKLHSGDSSTDRYNKFLFVLLGVVTMSIFSMYASH